ncbi:endolytic transglycosylase MltG [Fulvivirga sediminis]|uniref:Endolytic murein transglycosylase n=1 Tax=Fulvivirga sediminis TaxID=2803949 RepID=A0A937F8F1_9BACT|nr:endolytic transglycosylase MltG [Fulvivirga sediminis]MBL3656932.1 endolytic transglycosylase MltG [Fulvivirga sediminis]
MRNKKIFVIFLLIFTVLLSSFTFYAYQVIFTPNILVEKDDRIFIVSEDETFKSLQDKLHKHQYVSDMVSFSLLAKLMKYDENLKPGRYRLKGNMTNLEAVRLLRSGKQAPVNLTFTNIRLKSELAERLTSHLAVGEEEFNQALERFIENNKEGFNSNNVISLFIPNTYQVYYDISGEGLIERMLYEYKQFWNEERKAKAKNIGLTPLEVSTLASIVQAESVKRDESSKIAGLYMNRLKKGIALQADPTLVFASGDYGLKRVLNEHKEIDSPYNTYKYAGLPPGPINMPTIHSLDAVLNYEKHDYIYMCAKEDFSGYHNFAATYSEHIKNAKRYQRQLSIEQRKARLNNQN